MTAEYSYSSNRAGEKDWARGVMIGQMLTIDPLFNLTTGSPRDQIPVPVRVQEIRHQQSQTGVMFKVANIEGGYRWLDAGWFAKMHLQGFRL